MSSRIHESASFRDPFSRGWRILVPAFGLVFFATGIGILMYEIDFGASALQANGTIVDVRITDSGDGPNYHPVVEYIPANGRKVRFEGGATSPEPIVAQAVSVLYQPTNPEKAQIDSFSQRWLFPSIFLAVGAVLLTSALVARRNGPAASIWTPDPIPSTPDDPR